MNEAIIHMYMEMPQGNSLCSSLKQAKNVIFLFILYKIGEQEEEQVPPEEWGCGTNGRREEVVKECEHGTNTGIVSCM
jgi:hypothetical protein